ncbi:unnamed protein product [Ceutorhynchus assimilis]|uniref:Leucine-rich repeat-containing protein 56 n=1 Tax=Ceutorhynchus assimilis TaxID=467358 RepID=A0A9N9MCC6_9CUCU|nr:unnamed protein product [Ceutorhynchus assimilis]
MSPNLEDQMPDYSSVEPPNNDHITLTLTPLSDMSASTSYSDEIESIESEVNENEEVPLESDEISVAVVAAAIRNYVPMEHNIRELLVQVSNTEQLETVTQIKLRVIARELALQQLGAYLPALRELILDGSIISSLRDLGYGLKNLKILRVNRCQLPCIDGMLGFEYLEELYAADNSIRDLSACAFLSNLKIVDVRRNSIRHLGSLNFLSLCPELTHLFLDGNEALEGQPRYKNLIGRMLPQVQMLNGELLVRDEIDDNESEDEISVEDLEEDDKNAEDPDKIEVPKRILFAAERLTALSRPTPRNHQASGFTIRFPPKVCVDNGNIRSTES